MSDIIGDGTYVTITCQAPSLGVNEDSSQCKKEENIRNTNEKLRLQKLQEIKKGLELNGKIDPQKLNEVFINLEKEILGTKGLFDYYFDKKTRDYYLTYKGIKLNVPIKNPENLIQIANYTDYLIDKYIFKGEKEKFYCGKDRFNTNIITLNKENGFLKEIQILDTRIEGGELLREKAGIKNERILKTDGEIFSISKEFAIFLNAVYPN